MKNGRVKNTTDDQSASILFCQSAQAKKFPSGTVTCANSVQLFIDVFCKARKSNS